MNGSVVKKAGNWYVIIEQRDPETGKRLRKWHSGYKTKREAEAARVELLSRKSNGTYVDPSKVTVGTFLLDVWLPAAAPSLRPSTARSYRTILKCHVVPSLGALPLQRLAAADLNALYGRLLQSGRADKRGGLSTRTVRYIHTVLKKALSDATKWDLLVTNPAARTTPPPSRSSTKPLMNTWTPPEIKQFLSVASDDRLYAAWLAATTTGMRRGELLGLRWADLDLDRRRMSVRQSLVAFGGEIGVSPPKSGRARVIDLDAGTVRVLALHRLRQAEERLALGEWPDHDLVFTTSLGLPLHPDWFTRAFGRLVDSAGVRRIRLHDVRHTWATLALQANVHPKIVSERLGHSTIAITLDTYSHVMPAMQSEAAERVASVISAG